jgi:tRNA (guanine37-N1)-methyltransferase
MKRLKPDLLNIPKRRNVELVADRAEERLILLRREAREEGGKLHGLSEDCMAIIHELDGKPTTTSVSLSYNDFSAEQVLQRLLGNVLDEVPGAFETAGHIAHLNLREAALPYKHIIAQVILDKNNHIQTVVNKIGDVGSEFRTFPMEVLAGDDNTIVDLREGGCRFQFDFRHVYWNSRLQMEHGRLVKSIVNAGGEVVCDMMAGVGPFAVPLAKSGLTVYANDLNPQSYKYLALNAKLNKIEQHLHSSNMCGREHVRSLLSQGIVFQHVIMNLPANAIDFLDAFRGVCWADAGFPVPPQIHCYCFSREKDKVGDSLARVNEVLGSSLERNDIRVHLVRDVAPNKAMLCVSFQAPEAGPEQASKLVRSNGGDD